MLRRHKLLHRFSLFIYPLFICIALIVGVGFGYFEQTKETNRSIEHHKILQEQIIKISADSLYFFEYEALGHIMQTAVSNRDVQYIHVYNDTGGLVNSYYKPESSTPSVYENKVKIFSTAGAFAGTIYLGFSINEGKNYLDYYTYPLFSAVFLIMALAFILFLFWRKEVLLPISQVVLAMTKSDGDDAAYVTINREDELGLIANAYNDMLDRIVEHSRRIEYMADHDDLTGLLNQRAFTRNFKEVLAIAPDYKGCLIFIDIDRFKWINDTHGHLAGDQIIQVTAQRLVEALTGSILSRFGGDEFVAYIPGCPDNCISLLENIRTSVNKEVNLDGFDVIPSVCIGLACYPDDAQDYESLLQKADTAMYQAKTLGRNSQFIYNYFLDEINKNQRKVVEILQSYILQEAIDVYFQPIVDSKTGRVVSAESLLRLPKISHLGVPIELLIQKAEDSGYIWEIDKAIRRKALSYFSKWLKDGVELEDIHINTSAITFNRDDYADELLEDISYFQVPPSYITLEITESAAINNMAKVIESIARIKSHGIKIALDDFGTGYSSITMLTELQIDCLKLDKTFFPEEVKNSNLRMVTRHVISMAHTMGMEIIAEGAQVDDIPYLEELGSRLIQSYAYSKALPADEFIQYFQDSRVTSLQPM